MSYDLAFWRQNETEQRLPVSLYSAFQDGQQVEGIPELPVDDFLASLMQAYPSAIREPNGSSEWIVWTSLDSSSMFEVWWTPQYICVSMRPLNEDHAHELIDLASDVGCALYDPQTDERFAQRD